MNVEDPARYRLYLHASATALPVTNADACPPPLAPERSPLEEVASSQVAASAGEPDVLPPIPLSALHRARVRVSAELACLVFALPDFPWVSWTATHFWLECFAPRLSGVNDPLFSDADDLIKALPQLQAWLDHWSECPARVAPNEPCWAVDRGLGPVEVQGVARFIESKLATSTSLVLTFYSYSGEISTLTVPPQAALCLPPPTPSTQQAVQILAKEEFALCATPSGTEVFLPAELAAGLPASFAVDPRGLVKAVVTDAQRIRPIVDPADEGSSHD